MTVSISKPAINLREELTRLKSPAIIKPQRFQTFWFENLVTNGTFDTDTTGWSAGANTTISVVSNRLRVTNVGSNYGYAYQAFTTAVGKVYTVSVDITYNAGFARLLIASAPTATAAADINVDSSGTYTHTFVATATTTYVNVGNRNDTDIYNDFDNISIYEADPSDDAPWYRMPLGWKPFQVFEDGSLIREGSTHDYEVIFDGYTYFVKPSVAPGASTETQIVGVAT